MANTPEGYATPRISSLTIEASSKAWSQRAVSGDTGGTSLSWTVVPEKPGESWDLNQACHLSIMIRRQLHALLMADAMARGTSLPEGGQEALANYDAAIKAFGGVVHTEKSEKP